LNEAEKKVLKLLEDEQFRKTLGKNGRVAIESKYTVKRFIEQIENVYIELFS